MQITTKIGTSENRVYLLWLSEELAKHESPVRDLFVAYALYYRNTPVIPRPVSGMVIGASLVNERYRSSVWHIALDENGGPAGVCVWTGHRTRGWPINLAATFVVPKHRGRGIRNLLVDSAFETMRGFGYSRVQTSPLISDMGLVRMLARKSFVLPPHKDGICRGLPLAGNYLLEYHVANMLDIPLSEEASVRYAAQLDAHEMRIETDVQEASAWLADAQAPEMTPAEFAATWPSLIVCPGPAAIVVMEKAI